MGGETATMNAGDKEILQKFGLKQFWPQHVYRRVGALFFYKRPRARSNGVARFRLPKAESRRRTCIDPLSTEPRFLRPSTAHIVPDRICEKKSTCWRLGAERPRDVIIASARRCAGMRGKRAPGLKIVGSSWGSSGDSRRSDGNKRTKG